LCGGAPLLRRTLLLCVFFYLFPRCHLFGPALIPNACLSPHDSHQKPMAFCFYGPDGNRSHVREDFCLDDFLPGPFKNPSFFSVPFATFAKTPDRQPPPVPVHPFCPRPENFSPPPSFWAFSNSGLPHSPPFSVLPSWSIAANHTAPFTSPLSPTVVIQYFSSGFLSLLPWFEFFWLFCL